MNVLSVPTRFWEPRNNDFFWLLRGQNWNSQCSQNSILKIITKKQWRYTGNFHVKPFICKIDKIESWNYFIIKVLKTRFKRIVLKLWL